MLKLIALVSVEGTFFTKLEIDGESLKPGEIILKKENILNGDDPIFKKFFGKGLFKKTRKEELKIIVRESTSARSFKGENYPAFTIVIVEEKNN